MKLLQLKFYGRRLSFYLTLLYFLGVLGFTIGSLSFWFPVRWAINELHNSGATYQAESNAIKVAMILIFLVAGSLAYFINLRCEEAVGKNKLYFLLTPLIPLAIVLLIWYSPELNPSREKSSEDITLKKISFTFGPYPTADQISQLKKDHYAGIISLLHSAVVPFEPQLLEAERAATRRYGLQLIEAPMLPWVSENKNSIEIIKNLIKEGKGKYYVHCYLGKDRVNVVKRIIETASGSTEALGNLSHRTLNELKRFEKGSISYLGNSLYLIPRPSDEEFFGYLLSGYVKHIIYINDNPDSCAWIKTDKDAAQTYNMPSDELKFPLQNFTEKDFDNLYITALKVPKPAVIIVSTTKTRPAKSLVKYFRGKRNEVDPARIRELLSDNSIERLLPNIIFGSKYDDYSLNILRQQGFTSFYSFDAPAANRNSMPDCSFYSPQSGANIDSLMQFGRWYVFGKDAKKARELFR